MVPADPWTAAFGAVSNIGAAAMQKAPQMQDTQTSFGGFDSSGWAVNIGSGTQTPSYSKTTAQSAPGAALMSVFNNPVVLVGVLLAVYLIAKKK